MTLRREKQWLKGPRARLGASEGGMRRRGRTQSSAILDGWNGKYTRDADEKVDVIEIEYKDDYGDEDEHKQST